MKSHQIRQGIGELGGAAQGDGRLVGPTAGPGRQAERLTCPIAGFSDPTMRLSGRAMRIAGGQNVGLGPIFCLRPTVGLSRRGAALACPTVGPGPIARLAPTATAARLRPAVRLGQTTGLRPIARLSPAVGLVGFMGAVVFVAVSHASTVP
ncbi:hypothetical protein [Streptomyces sp. NPDC059909]|uniref:hypothetical protein n=1 Tax=Streptomyces sp. NPDC059909 TaxID=3346998 RepID=UPI00365E711A